MLSRKVDKVSKDVEGTRDPRGLQVGETPPDDSGVPQPQSSLGIHVTGEVWFGENATQSVSCKLQDYYPEAVQAIRAAG